MKNVKFIIIAILLLFIIALNIFFIKSYVLGIVFGFFYLTCISYFLGKNLFCKEENKTFQFLLGFIFLLGIIILSGTILYYLIGLFDWIVLITLFMPTIIIYLLKLKSKITIEQLSNKNNSFSLKSLNFSVSQFLLLFSYLLLIIFLFYILFTHRTSDAIVSPWQALPSYFFIIYFLATFLLIIKILTETEKKDSSRKIQFPSIYLIILHSLLTVSVALIIYKIGYGFDPFVHRAAEQYILAHGFIFPKNPYYIGQYSLVIILSKLFSINFALIDKILVPFLSSLILPCLTYFTFIKFNLKEKIVHLTSLASTYLILFTIFFTVPQHLANLFLIVFVFLLLLYLNEKIIKLYHLWLLSLIIAAIHPLAGFPALLFCWFLSLRSIKKIIVIKIITAVLFLFALFGVPLLFLTASKILSGFQVTLNLSNLKNIFTTIPSLSYTPFHSFLHSLYLLKSYFIFFIIISAIIGFYCFYKRTSSTTNNITIKQYNNFAIFPALIMILLLNALSLQLLTFKSIIYYEQNIFPFRLLHFTYFFALPFILYAIYLIIKKITYNKKNIYPAAFTLSFILCSIFYLTYPRYDVIEKNKGFAVSQYDIGAVHLIDSIVKDENYVVLANQSTSAAALQEFGFKKYFSPSASVLPKNTDQQIMLNDLTNRTTTMEQKTTADGLILFYYPIPTSSPLYKIYLDITYQEMQNEFIKQAKSLTGAEKIFIVFSDYWTNYKKLWTQGKQTAKNYYNINNKIMVFEF